MRREEMSHGSIEAQGNGGRSYGLPLCIFVPLRLGSQFAVDSASTTCYIVVADLTIA
jgi:hypothetical protein